MIAKASAILALCSIAVVAQQPFRATIEGVAIQVSVRAGNKPVAGLTAQDFELRDNGVPQRITAAAAEQLPLDLTLLLDSSASVDGATLQQLKSAVDDTVGLLRPDDRVRLIAVSQVFQQVFDFRPKGSSIALETLGAQGATSLYDALAAGMMRVSDPGRRQLVIAFTDGRDSTSILDETSTREIARFSDAVVDVVLPVSKQEEPPDRPPVNNTMRQPLDTLLTSGAAVVTGSPSEMADRARDLQPWARKDALAATLAQIVAPTAVHARSQGLDQPRVPARARGVPVELRDRIRPRRRGARRVARRHRHDYTAGKIRRAGPQGLPGAG